MWGQVFSTEHISKCMPTTGHSIVDLERTFNKLLEVYKTSHASFKLNLYDKIILKIFANFGVLCKR